MGDATEMDTPRQSIAGRVRRSAASLGLFDYGATLVLLAVYVVGTSMDEGPKTSMDFYRAVASVIPTLLISEEAACVLTHQDRVAGLSGCTPSAILV
jgi:hypothetical protein